MDLTHKFLGAKKRNSILTSTASQVFRNLARNCGFFIRRIKSSGRSVVFRCGSHIRYDAQHKRASAVVKGLTLHGDDGSGVALVHAEGGLKFFAMPLRGLQ